METALTPKASIYHRVLSLFTKRTDKEVIKNHHEAKKIKDFAEVDLKELAKKLRLIAFAHFGIQTPITDFAMMAIMDMLQDYYADLSAEEIYSAFKACAAGEYQDDKKELLKPYGQFSVQFVGQVLNCYSRNKIALLKKAEIISKKQLPEKEPVYVTNDHVYNSLVIWVKWQKKLPAIWLWDAAWQHLVSLEKLKGGEFTYEQKQAQVIKHLVEMFPEVKSSIN